MRVPCLVLLVLTASLAGCVSQQGLGEDASVVEDAQDISEASFRVPRDGVSLVRVEAVGDAVVNLTLANNRDPDAGVGDQMACGSAEWSRSPVFPGAGSAWLEGPGDAVRAGAGGKGVAVPGGGNGAFVVLDFEKHYDGITLREGESMWVRLSAVSEDGKDPIYKPSADITARGPVRIQPVEAPQFACSTRVGGGDGLYVQTAVGPTVTVVRDGRITFDTINTTDARVGVFGSRASLPGSCQVAIVLDGTAVNESSEINDFCAAAHVGPPGVYDLEYETTATNAKIWWFIWS